MQPDALLRDNFETSVGNCIEQLDKNSLMTFIGDPELITLLQIRQKWFELKLGVSGINVEYLPSEVAPIFFWLKDNKSEGVFSFAESQTKARGIAFHTQDSDLLGVFHSMFENKWDEAQRS
jgi:hypothetical protein